MSILLKLIQLTYENNIHLKDGATSQQIDFLKKFIDFKIPNELLELLSISNGIEETMYIPQINQTESISHIVYSIEMIISENKFYSKEYNLNNILIFSDNGIGNPILINSNLKIYLFDCIDNQLEYISNDIVEYFYKQ